MNTKMKRKEKECFNYAQRWNKNWDNYCLVVSSFFAGYETSRNLLPEGTPDCGNELVDVEVGMHQLEQNYRRGLLDYESIIHRFFKDFNSKDIKIHRSNDGVISIQASFKVMDGKS